MNATITKDFGDWLSPMLVKEMRQGLRARVFVSAFLLMQCLMIFCVIMSLTAADDTFGNASSGFFWMMIGLPLLLVMPARGFGVLGSEIKGNTLELIFLTRLSSWRIVAGKWTAIIAQTLLLACSVLPYTVLRYFLGGINLLDDLQVLFVMIVVSAILTAVAVALSPFYRSWLAKIILSFGPFLLIWLGVVFFESQRFFHGMGTSPSASDYYIIVAVLGPLFLLLMFEIAVARIAPPAENHSFRKRLLGLLLLAAISILKFFRFDPYFLQTIGIVLLLPICVTSLCEELKLIPSIYLPFVKRGFFGRLAGVIFYPGWPGGLLYSLLTLAVFLFIFFNGRKSGTPDSNMLQIAFLGGLLLPLAIEKICFARFRKTFAIYMGLQVFMFVIMLLASGLKDSPYVKWMKLASPLPTSVFFLKLFDRIDDVHDSFFLATVTIVTWMSLLLLFFKLMGEWKKIRAMENEATGELMNPGKPLIANADAA